jgi:hypothetical protein
MPVTIEPVEIATPLLDDHDIVDEYDIVGPNGALGAWRRAPFSAVRAHAERVASSIQRTLAVRVHHRKTVLDYLAVFRAPGAPDHVLSIAGMSGECSCGRFYAAIAAPPDDHASVVVRIENLYREHLARSQSLSSESSSNETLRSF